MQSLFRLWFQRVNSHHGGVAWQLEQEAQNLVLNCKQKKAVNWKWQRLSLSNPVLGGTVAQLHHGTFPVVLPAGDQVFSARDSAQSLSSKAPGIFLIVILTK